jgi:hypothetical protein
MKVLSLVQEAFARLRGSPLIEQPGPVDRLVAAPEVVLDPIDAITADYSFLMPVPLKVPAPVEPAKPERVFVGPVLPPHHRYSGCNCVDCQRSRA